MKNLMFITLTVILTGCASTPAPKTKHDPRAEWPRLGSEAAGSPLIVTGAMDWKRTN